VGGASGVGRVSGAGAAEGASTGRSGARQQALVPTCGIITSQPPKSTLYLTGRDGELNDDAIDFVHLAASRGASLEAT
jgi:hypothetical protein